MKTGHQWLGLLALAGSFGCSAGDTTAVSAEVIGTFAGAADAMAIELSQLGASRADVLLLAPERKVLEVFASDGGGYQNVGSSFIGGSEYVGDGTPVATRAATLMIDGVAKHVLLTQLGGMLITMVVPGLEAHLLEYPVRVYHRQYGDIQSFSVADVDGDGSDELLVGEGWGVAIVELTPSLEVMPEAPVDQATTTTRIDEARGAGAIAASDVDGDGIKDVITLDPDGSIMHVYMQGNANLVEQFTPAKGADAVASDCPSVAAFLHLADGQVVALSRTSVPEQKTMGHADVIVSSGDFLVTSMLSSGKLRIYDSCGAELGEIDPGQGALVDLALLGDTLAVLDANKGVKLFRIAAVEE